MLSVQVDFVSDGDGDLYGDVARFATENEVTAEVVTERGPGGGGTIPIVQIEGDDDKVIKCLTGPFGYSDDDLWSLFRIKTYSNAFFVDKGVTTDKLGRMLNAYVNDGWDPTAHYVGGRDWVIVARRAE